MFPGPFSFASKGHLAVQCHAGSRAGWVSYLGVLSPGATPCPHQKGHQNGEGEAWPCSDDTKHQTHSAGHTRPALTCSTRCLQKGLAVLQDSVPGTLGSPVCPIWEAVTFP